MHAIHLKKVVAAFFGEVDRHQPINGFHVVFKRIFFLELHQQFAGVIYLSSMFATWVELFSFLAYGYVIHLPHNSAFHNL